MQFRSPPSRHWSETFPTQRHLLRSLLALAYAVAQVPAAAQDVRPSTDESRTNIGAPVGAEAASARDPGVEVPYDVSHLDQPASRRGPHLSWPRGQREVSWGEVVSAGVLAGGVVAVRQIGSTEQPRWTRVNRFDAAVRRGLRLTPSRLETAALGSDITLYTVAAYPVLIENLGLVLIRDRNPRLMAQLAVIDGQAYALMGLLMGVSKLATSRQRPYAHGYGCSGDRSHPGCGNDDRNRAFFSGHAAMAFTGAGLVCFHNQLIPNLYGKRATGLAICGTGLALATSTALFRVMGDKHWGTDVLAGAGVGLFSGWVLPWLLHGRTRTFLDIQGKHVQGAFGPFMDNGAHGLGFQATF